MNGPGQSLSQLEQARLSALHRYQILGSKPEVAFDRIVQLTQNMFGVPIVLLNFVGEAQQWTQAAHGVTITEVSLEHSFCLETIRQNGILLIPDTLERPGSNNNPWVTGAPYVRFYAGAPLSTPEGYKVGTLCLIDTVPHPEFDDDAQQALEAFAALAVGELELRRATREVEKTAARTQAILESITEAFFTLDRRWNFTYLNVQAQRLLQQDSDLHGRHLWDIFPDLRETFVYDIYLNALENGVAATFEMYYPPFKTWFEAHVYPAEEGVAVYFQDIGARKESEQRAQIQTEFRRDLLDFTQTSLQDGLNEHFYQKLLESAVRTVPGAQAGSLLINKAGEHHFAAAVGFDLEALQACVFDDATASAQFDLNLPEPQLVYSWPGSELTEAQRSVMETKGLTREIRVSLCVPIAVNGQTAVTLYLDNFEDAEAFDAVAVEMTRVLAQQATTLMQRLELEAALRREQATITRVAHYDALTGLPNRILFDDRLRQAVAQVRRSGKPLAVLFFDLDHFKDVNDSYGHHVGDALISGVAARAWPLLREGDTLAHWGGDEFVAILANLTHVGEAVQVAERILGSLRKPFVVAGLELQTGASLGIADYSGTENAEDLLKNAEIALYQAKKERGSVHIFSDTLRRDLELRIELGKDLRAALAANALTLHYQPRVRLEDGTITSLEALARWPHPEGGFIPPSVFIPLAEELGLIRKLGTQLLDQACAQAKCWQQAGLPYRVAVNLSVEQLKHPQIVEEVRGALQRHHLSAALLELEITESTAMSDVGGNIAKLQQLRDLGVKLAIDDFGTAYSSLAYLKRLPVHSLKIDRAFVKDIAEEGSNRPADTRIPEAVLALAQSFDLDVVAEGVETRAQQQVLLALGCKEAQGYLFAAPLEADKVTRLLERAAAEFRGR